MPRLRVDRRHPGLDLDEAVAAVRRWVDEGYRAVKLGQFGDAQFGYDAIEGVYISRPVDGRVRPGRGGAAS